MGVVGKLVTNPKALLKAMDGAALQGERGAEFLRTPDGTIYGATYINPDTGQREYYINPARLSPETLIHETYHPFDDMMAEAAKSGDAHAKAAIARLDKLAEENGYLDRVKNNPAYADRTAEQQRAEARVQMVGEVGNAKLDKSFYDKLKTAVEDAIKWIADKFGVSLKDFTTDQIMNLKLDDLVSASLGSARRGEFSAIGQKSQSDAGNISFQKEGNINTLTDEAAKEINKRILDGDNVFDASVAVFDAMRKDGRLKGVNELELKNEVSKKLTVETTAKKFETEPDLKAAEKELSGIKVGLIPEDKKGTYLSARPSDVKMLEEGRRAVDSGEVSPREIMNRIIAGVGGVKNIFISPLEVAALIYHKAKLDAADRDLQRRIAEAESAGDSAKVTQLTILWENILAQIDDFHRTSEITGATQSSSFRLRQYMLENEYSALYQRHYIERATGKPIPAEVMRQLQEYEAEIKKIRERVDELEKKEKEQARELRSLRRKQNDKTTSTDGKAGPTRKTTSTTIGRRVAKRASEKLRSAKWDLTIDELSSLQSSPVPLVKAAWNASIEAAALSMEGLGFTVDLAATAIKAGVNAMKATEWYKGLSDKSKAKAIAALQAQIGDMVISAQKEIDGRVTVDGGIVNVSYSYLSDLVDAGMNTVEKAHAAIKKHIEDLGLDPNGEVTDRAIRDAIGGYQRIMGKTVKQLRADVAKLRSLARLQGELEDVRGRKARETNPRKKRLLSAEEKALKRQIAEAEMEVDLSQEQIDAIWKKAYKATEKRLQNEIEALDLKIERAKQGKPTDKKKPDLSGITKDARIKTLRATRDNLKETLKQLQTSEKDNMKKRVEAAEARIERHIAQMREQMRTGNYAIPPSPKPLRSAKLDRLRQERDEIRKRRDALRDQSPERKARAAEKRIKALTAKIEKLNKQISGEVALESKKRAKVEKTDRELVMGEIIRDLEKQLKETAQYKAEADKRYNEYTRKRAKEKIKRYKEILDEFERTGTMPEPVPKKARNLEKATKDILREQAKLKTRMDIAREQYIFSQKPLWFKAVSTALHAMNIPIGLMASFDFSAVLRQGLPLALANPKQAVKAFRDMMSHGFRHRKAEEFMEDMKDWKYYALAKQSGLWLSEPTAKLSAQEERFMGRFVAKIPHVRISANLYNVYLNSLRMGVFEKFADMNIEGGRSLFWRRGGADITNKADQKMFTDMAKFINNITGRGTWLSESGTGASSSPFINAMFFAPRYMVSRFNIVVNSLTGYASYHPAVRVEALRTVYGYIGAMTAVMQLAILAGFEVEDDPRSSDFGKINIDGIRVDLWAGFVQVARLLSVTAAQSRKNLSGKVVPLNEPGYKSETVMDNWIRFIRSKSSPAMGAVWDWSVREKGKWKEGVFGFEERVHFQNMIGEDMTISDKIIESITPLAFSDIWTIYQNHGLDTAVLMFPAALGGASISDIPARPSKKSRNQLIDAFGDQAIDTATEDFDFDPSEFDIDDFDDLDVE